MSAKLLKNLTAAHLNALGSSIKALEIQITALKTVLVGLPGDEKEEDDLDHDDEEKPAKKAKPSKKKPVEEDEDGESDSDEESDEDVGEDSEDEDDKPSHSKKEVVEALQAYTAANDRPAAMKVLKKIGGVKSVHDLDPTRYGKLVAALEL